MREGIYAGTQAVEARVRRRGDEHVGYCIGGTLLGDPWPTWPPRGDKRIASATFFAAQQDFSEAGDLLLFTNEDWLRSSRRRWRGGGVLSGQTMADTFNALRANDLIWSFFVNNYLLGKEPKPFDLLFWNSGPDADAGRCTSSTCASSTARTRSPRAMTLDNVRLDLRTVKTPIYVQSSKEDHIAPARSVYKGARLFGGR